MKTQLTHAVRPSLLDRLQPALLACGILAALYYVFINVIVAMRYAGYDWMSQTVSELSAIGAPTSALWNTLVGVYAALTIAFAVGVRHAGTGNRWLRIAGNLLLVHAIIGIGWPLAPMHQREALAAGQGSFSDTMHLVYSGLTVIFMVLVIVFAAAAFGRPFRLFSIATLIVLVVTGMFTGMAAPRVEANLPTPWVGVWERISIAAYLLWVVVLAIMLLERRKARALELSAD